MVGRSFGREKNYSLTVTVSSVPWWDASAKMKMMGGGGSGGDEDNGGDTETTIN